jgi:hypothetical protein
MELEWRRPVKTAENAASRRADRRLEAARTKTLRHCGNGAGRDSKDGHEQKGFSSMLESGAVGRGWPRSARQTGALPPTALRVSIMGL